MDNGAEIYRRFLEGDEGAFDDLYDLYHDSLIYFINGYVHNMTVAEDLAADAFMELIVHRKRYSFKSLFKTYLFSIGRHKAFDYLRREKRHAEFYLENLSEDQADIADIEKTVITDETKKTIKRIIADMNRDYASVIYLLYLEELSADEIAVMLKKSKKQIANLTYRAKSALKTAMEKEGFKYDE